MNRKYEKLMEDQIDDIDAAIFSGDTFMDTEVIADFRSMMARWEKQLKENEEIIADLETLGDFVEYA